jgi:tRNA A-37 threonylcarbamoyl transferase component Bud32
VRDASPPRPTGRIRWLAGDPGLCQALDQAWEDPASAGAERTVLRDRPERRRLLRFRWHPGPDLFVKQFYMAGQRHRARKRLVRILRVEAARREWRALCRLDRAGVPVPTPRALGILPGGDRILAMDHLPGKALDAALREASEPDATVRGETLDPPRLASELGRLLAALHAQGVVHRDLHHGNVFLGEAGPVLLDLQLARPGRSRRARLRDVGDLECSLERTLSLTSRVRFRAAALDLSRPFDAGARRLLRAAGEAASERASAHSRSRRRRTMYTGRRFRSAIHAGARGLRVADFGADLLEQALVAHDAGKGQELKNGARTRVSAVRIGGQAVVVKEFRPAGLTGRVTEHLQGSGARRCWRAGFGLEAHGIGSARPLAYLERRRAGLPAGSLLVLEDLRPGRRASELDVGMHERVVAELARLLVRLAAHRILHGDLTADRVWWVGQGDALELRISGLEHVRFDTPLSDAERASMRARLDATLPGGGLSSAGKR